ncbi:hypothetical protein YC2023_050606 [Brassica napus]
MMIFGCFSAAFSHFFFDTTLINIESGTVLSSSPEDVDSAPASESNSKETSSSRQLRMENVELI